jgi:glucokinase
MSESSTIERPYLIGIDLGGTKILAGLFDKNLNCLARSKKSTKASKGYRFVVERISKCVEELQKDYSFDFKEVSGLGIGAPGSINSSKGSVIFAPNLDWKDKSLGPDLQDQLNIPTIVDNDCNLATLGAYHHEFIGKVSSALGLFIGTGIGAGLILNDELYSGFNHTAGEIGHMVMSLGGPKCGCGNKGCFEAIASRTGISKAITNEIKNGRKSILTEMLGKDLEELKSGDLRKAYAKGDKLVQETIHTASNTIGIAIANMINLICPEVIILGGGLIEQMDTVMMPIISKSAEDHAMTGAAEGVRVISTSLGDNAAIQGAAVLASRM